MQHIELLRNKILQYHPQFDSSILEKGLQKFKVSEEKAGNHLLNSGEVCNYFSFAMHSISRCYANEENGEEKTVWIEPEQRFITDFISFKTNTPSRLNIQVYEDTLVYKIYKDDLEELYRTYHDWAFFGVNILEEYLLYTFNITNQFVNNTATENYLYIERFFPRFIHVVPLKHIASRLNISPVTISRIRASRREVD